eukprot:s13340_g2.t1
MLAGPRDVYNGLEALSGVSATLQKERQLVLVRLPGHLVIGPMRPTEPTEITEGDRKCYPSTESFHFMLLLLAECPLRHLWFLSTVRRPRDRVLLVYHIDCSPLSHFYEAHFTIFRRKEASSAPAQNLGFSEDTRCNRQ